MKKIVSQRKSEYVIVYADSRSDILKAEIQMFADAIRDKAKFDFSESIANDRIAKEFDKEIIIGNVASRKESVEEMRKLSYTGYSVSVKGEKLVISAYCEALIRKALEHLLTLVNEDRDLILEDDYRFEGDDARVATEVPDYRTEKGTLEGIYYCGEGNYQISVKGTNEAEYLAYIKSLEEKGYKLYAENKIAESLFKTYIAPNGEKQETVIYVMFYPTLGRAKVVYGPRGYLPSTEPIPAPENPATPPTITQQRRLAVYSGNHGKSIDGAPGMCLIIQLADGSFIVIDGGTPDGVMIPKEKVNGEWKDGEPINSHDKEDLYKFLCDHTPNGGKPVIAGWFITHPHGDHMGIANNFLKDYGEQVEIRMAGYNFPDMLTTPVKYERPIWLENTLRPFCDWMKEHEVDTVIFHAGQKIYFPGCEVEVIYTQEDYYPQQFHWGNNLSSAFRMKFGEKVFLVLGDCEKPNCQQMADAYGKELKCDILQLSHHGFNGACLDLYQYADPDICLWACDDYRFDVDKRCLGTTKGYDFNLWLRDTAIKERVHYTAAEDATISV